MVVKLAANPKDKKTYGGHIKDLVQALKYCLKLKKVHWVITFEHKPLDEALHQV